MKSFWKYYLLFLMVSACSSYAESSSDTVVSEAISALGGHEFFNNLKSLQFTTQGSTYASYMGFKPANVKKTTDYQKTYTYLFEENVLRTDATRNFVYEPSHGFQKQNYTVVIKNGFGAVSDGAMPLGLPGGQLPPQTVASMEKLALLSSPHLLLKEIVNGKRGVLSIRSFSIDDQDFTVLSVKDPISPIDIYIDRKSKLISKVETTENHLLLRDSRIVVEFSNWTQFNNRFFPGSTTVTTSGKLLRKEMATSVVVNPQTDDSHFDFPYKKDVVELDSTETKFGSESVHIHDEFFEIAGLYYGENSKFSVTEIAPGVYEFRDSTYSHLASLAVVIDNKLIVLEAITSPTSADQLIKNLHEVFPDKPIDYLVQSHHHIDHSAGVRSLIAAGAHMIVGYGSANWWENILARSSKLKPDSLAETPNAKINITEVELGSNWQFKGRELTLTAHHIQDNSHAIDMLLTTIVSDDQTIVYVADLYNAGFGFTMSYDGPSKLFKALKKIGLINEYCKSDKTLEFLPSHGQKISLTEAVSELKSLGKAIDCKTL